MLNGFTGDALGMWIERRQTISTANELMSEDAFRFPIQNFGFEGSNKD
jgi:hypothetical protein